MSTELTPDAPQYAEAWRLYEASFSADTRRAPADQRRVLRDPRYRFCAVGAPPDVDALWGLWSLDGFAFLEHLAVRPELRGRGLGTRLLRELTAVSSTLVLEVEPPQDADSSRRVRFYERVGFHRNREAYVQPPYGPGKRAVSLLLLSHPRALAPAEFDLVRGRLHREVYGLAAPLLDLPETLPASGPARSSAGEV